MKISTSILLILLMLPVCFAQVKSMRTGSVIVVIRTPDEIAVAADSKVLNTGGKAEQSCKLRLVNNTLFAVTGISSIKESGYDVFDIAAAACKRGGPLGERVKYFESIITPALVEQMELMRRVWPERWESKYRGTTAALCIVFVGVEAGRPVVYRRCFKPDGAEGITVEVEATESAADGGGGIVFLLAGHADAVAERLQSGGRVTADNLALLAARFVQIQIDSGDEGVGGPVDSASVTKDGFKWGSRKPQCN